MIKAPYVSTATKSRGGDGRAPVMPQRPSTKDMPSLLSPSNNSMASSSMPQRPSTKDIPSLLSPSNNSVASSMMVSPRQAVLSTHSTKPQHHVTSSSSKKAALPLKEKNASIETNNSHPQRTTNSSALSRSVYKKGAANSTRMIQVMKKRKQKDDTLLSLKSNLSRFARHGDRNMIVTTLRNCTYLRSLILSPSEDDGKSSVALADEQDDEADDENLPVGQRWPELEQEICASHLRLNGNMLGAGGLVSGREVTRVLQTLCQKLTEGSTSRSSSSSGQPNNLSPTTLYRRLLVRTAPSTSASDCFFRLNSLLGSPDLLLQQERSPGNNKRLVPPDLVIYEAHGQVHATITTYHRFGLYRKHDVASGTPWIVLAARVHERVNLSTKQAVRTVALRAEE